MSELSQKKGKGIHYQAKVCRGQLHPAIGA